MHNIFYLRAKKAAYTAAFLIISFCLLFLVASCSDQQTVEQSKEELSQLKNQSNKNGNAANSSQAQTNESDAKKIAEYTIFLTSAFTGADSQRLNSFNCEDKVFAVIEFNHYPAKLHQLRFSWKDPRGEERELNEFPFFVTGDQTFAWAALKLHRSVGAGMLQWINPAAGMEEFIGTWTIDVSAEGLFEQKVEFEVLC